MRYARAVALTTMAAFSALAATHLEAQSARPFEPPRARIVRANRGQVLSSPSNASHAAIVAQYLRDHGRSDATVRSLVALGQSRPKNGLSHSRFEQRVAGLKVYATYLKATIDGQGALLHVIENLASVPMAGSDAPRLTSRRPCVWPCNVCTRGLPRPAWPVRMETRSCSRAPSSSMPGRA